MGARWRRGSGGERQAEQPGGDPGGIGPEHSWWAERDELSGMSFARPTTRRLEPEPEPEATWSYWTSWWRREPLFEHERRAQHRADPDGASSGDELDTTRALAVLGLPPDASMADVVAARRRLAKRFHPDVAGGDASADAEEMRRINAAYAELRPRLLREA